MLYVNLMHILIQGPLLIYIALTELEFQTQKKSQNIRPLVPKLFYAGLIGLSVMIPFSVWFPSTEQIMEYNTRAIINLAHYLIWMPLLFYIGYNGVNQKKSSIGLYWALLILGIMIFPLHFYFAYQKW